jgi:hypothetical protein
VSHIAHRTLRRAALGIAVALALTVLLPGVANAAAYRYWGYYQLSGDTWQFATKGPDQTKPADGSVEGWRYAVGSEGSSRTPRVTVTFDDICGDTKAQAGKKRVGVVIDYGRAADTEDGSTPPEPRADCASVDEAASGSEVLAAVGEVRAENGLVCAIDEEPATGCGGEVKQVSAAAKAPDQPVKLQEEKAAAPAEEKQEDDTPVGTYIGIAVVVAAAAGLGVVALRRRQAA